MAEKIQLSKIAGEHLGVKPDKDGFYFIGAKQTIGMLSLANLLAKVTLDEKVRHHQEVERLQNRIKQFENPCITVKITD